MAGVLDAQHLVNLSLKKIFASRSKRGGADLHRSLLLASVLLKARNACFHRSTDFNDTSHSTAANESSVVTAVAKDNVTTSDGLIDTPDDVTVTLDEVPSCENSGSSFYCATQQQQQQRQDFLPDQALEECDVLGADIFSEHLDEQDDAKNHEHSDSKSGETKILDFSGVEIPEIRHQSSEFINCFHSRKRTVDDETDDDFVISKRQKTENVVDCENLCMDFDDLISSVQDSCSLEASSTTDSHLTISGESSSSRNISSKVLSSTTIYLDAEADDMSLSFQLSGDSLEVYNQGLPLLL